MILYKSMLANCKHCSLEVKTAHFMKIRDLKKIIMELKKQWLEPVQTLDWTINAGCLCWLKIILGVVYVYV